MRFGLFFLIYVVVGLLVAGGIIGNEDSYFSGLDNLEEIIEMVLAVLLWPLVLLGVDINLGDDGSGGGGSEVGGEGGSGGESSGAGAGGDGGSGGGSAGPAGSGGGGK
jgi:hypothetical protein